MHQPAVFWGRGFWTRPVEPRRLPAVLSVGGPAAVRLGTAASSSYPGEERRLIFCAHHRAATEPPGRGVGAAHTTERCKSR